MEIVTLVTASAGLAFGFLGAVLGILNTWRAFDRDKMRIRVVPVWLASEQGEGFGIQVTNLSYFPVTITGIGFTQRHSDERLVFFPSDLQGCHLPQRMEPRTAFTAILPIGAGNERGWSAIKAAFVETACGSKFTGTSGALKTKIWKAAALR